MRVKITRPLSGQIDGIPLARFACDAEYELGTSLANFLIASGWAVPASTSGTPATAPATVAVALAPAPAASAHPHRDARGQSDPQRHGRPQRRFSRRLRP